ncbi:MAG: class I SAM-dependent methyltransferase [Caldilineales bacterium]|nr:class I SAM-dependent methyltransferase [Caldilineales bacterium]MDW8316609.1 class I SAM-dependent methyltransferase [Anaerolineae bacterium]
MSSVEQSHIQIENALGVCNVRQDTRLLAQETAQAVMKPVTGRALDLGTGSGYVGIFLALRGWQVDAVDVSPRALKQARRNAALNGVQMRIFRSNLFEAVEGCYDIIACNPPMRGNETEWTRLLTSTLRRVEPLANLLLRLIGPVLERKRLAFLVEMASRARQHLHPAGRFLLVISPWEAKALLEQVPGFVLISSRPVEGIPGLQVVTFGLATNVGHAMAEPVSSKSQTLAVPTTIGGSS